MLRLKVIERNSGPDLQDLGVPIILLVLVGVGEGLDEGDSWSTLLPAAEFDPFSRSFRWRLNLPIPGLYISMLGRSCKIQIKIYLQSVQYKMGIFCIVLF